MSFLSRLSDSAVMVVTWQRKVAMLELPSVISLDIEAVLDKAALPIMILFDPVVRV